MFGSWVVFSWETPVRYLQDNLLNQAERLRDPPTDQGIVGVAGPPILRASGHPWGNGFQMETFGTAGNYTNNLVCG